MSLDAAELRELRSLHEKAYGRDSALTLAEGARMRELERRRRAEESSSQPPPSLTVAPVRGDDEPAQQASTLVDALPLWKADVGHDRRPGQPEGASAAEASRKRPTASVGGVAEAEVPESASAALRRWWPPLAAASAILLAAGIGVGWLFFGKVANGDLPLTDEQDQRRADLYVEGDYDEGSVKAIGQEEDALVWYATREGGELACAILDVGGASSGRCLPVGIVREQGISVFVSLTLRGAESGESEQVYAYVLQSTTGAPMASIQRMATRADGDPHGGDGVPPTAENGQRAEVGGEHGDPIEVGTEP